MKKQKGFQSPWKFLAVIGVVLGGLPTLSARAAQVDCPECGWGYELPSPNVVNTTNTPLAVSGYMFVPILETIRVSADYEPYTFNFFARFGNNPFVRVPDLGDVVGADIVIPFPAGASGGGGGTVYVGPYNGPSDDYQNDMYSTESLEGMLSDIDAAATLNSETVPVLIIVRAFAALAARAGITSSAFIAQFALLRDLLARFTPPWVMAASAQMTDLMNKFGNRIVDLRNLLSAMITQSRILVQTMGNGVESVGGRVNSTLGSSHFIDYRIVRDGSTIVRSVVRLSDLPTDEVDVTQIVRLFFEASLP